MSIKGQYLRLFLDHRCLACALSCSLDLNAQIEDITTKDTEGDFTENECVGKSWGGQAESLLVNHGDYSKTANCDDQLAPDYDDSLLFSDYITLQPGDRLVVHRPGDVYIFNADIEELYFREVGNFHLFIHDFEEEEKDVYIAVESSSPQQVPYEIYRNSVGLPELLYAIHSGSKLHFKMSTIEPSPGTKNRIEKDTLMTGECLISSLQVSSINRKRVVCTARLTGVGEPEWIY